MSYNFNDDGDALGDPPADNKIADFHTIFIVSEF